MTDYIPKEAFVLKSGKYVGTSLDQLMFVDCTHILYLLNVYKDDSSQKSQLYKHLIWLSEQATTRQITAICPHCNENTMKYFALISDRKSNYKTGLRQTCCANDTCQNKLKKSLYLSNEYYFRILAMEFDSMLNVRHKKARDEISKLLKRIFGLPKKLTRELAFNFFAQ
ncbi:MAG: hypothetical protein ACKUBY_03425 [Candidatus Moraniibacteriota bacterium]|jgi:DNA gyrase/topoisomerase IV subunit A